MSIAPPSSVLETSLYADDLEAATQFYGDVLGLEEQLRTDGTHVTFQCGSGVVHVFDPAASREPGSLPAHGPDGPSHVAFAVAPDRLSDWRARFDAHDVAVEHEHDWGDRGQSLYVRDPAGNSVELAPPSLWGTADRDRRLTSARPRLDVDPGDSNPVERFQHETLRPVLKLLNPTLLRLVAARLARYGVAFTEMDRADQRDRLRNLIKEDEGLTHTLLGAVVGQLTEAELTTYCDHTDEVRRRCVSMLLARAQDQIETIHSLAEAAGRADDSSPS